MTWLQVFQLNYSQFQEYRSLRKNILGVFCDFNSIAGFNELLTHQCRRMFYQEHLMLIPPEKCFLGNKICSKDWRKRAETCQKIWLLHSSHKTFTQIGKKYHKLNVSY